MPFNRPIPDAKRPSIPSVGLSGLIEAEKLMQIALLLPSAVGIGWLAGAWADSRFHQSWMAIFGIVFGGISGLVYVIRMALTAEKKSRPDTTSENGNEDGSPDPKP
jgi:ATP synthase protein I